MTYIIIIAIVYALLRAVHDNHLSDGKWKVWAFVEGVFLAVVVSHLVAENWADYTLLPFIFGLVFWIVFDSACGLLRARKLFYFGSGRFDQFINKSIKYPFWFFVWKLVWLGAFVTAYNGWSALI